MTWGRVPIWGFANVVETRHDAVSEGERWFGYFPMSTELVVVADRVDEFGMVDGSAHRAALPPIYNRYARTAADPGYVPALEAEQMLYRPLFFTSVLIEDQLVDHDFYGASTVLLSSASSKTAFGVAHLLSRRGGVNVVGLTSPRNVDFVASLGCYDEVFAYEVFANDGAAALPDGPAVLIDISGNPSVVRSVHDRYGDELMYSAAVGLTHWEEFGERSVGPMPGPAPEMFFAPVRVEKRRADWGPRGLEAMLAEAWPPFVEAVSGWVEVAHLTGADAVRSAWVALADGSTTPDRAHVLHVR